MSAPSDLEQWRRQWQTLFETADAADRKAQLLAETQRQTLRVKLAMVGPALVTLIAGGATLVSAINSHKTADVILALGVWGFIVLVWAGALWLARGTWKPLDTTTQEFLRLSIQRCRSTLYALRFGATMYVLGVASALLWQHRYASASLQEILTSWRFVVFGLVLGPALIGVLSSWSRRKQAELQELLELQGQLRD